MRRSTVFMVAVALVGAACGGDGDGGDTAAACDAWVTAEHAIDIEEDIEAGIAALTDFVSAAPDDVASKVEPVIPLLEDDPEAVFESEEVVAAETAADDYVLESCGYERIDLKAFDYAYGNAPQELESGRVVFNFTNESEAGEAHETLLLRKNDRDTDSAPEVLARALEGPISVESTLNAIGQFEFTSVGFLEPGDNQDVFTADLEPGEYILACLLPVDTPQWLDAYFGGQELEGDQHFDKGMYAEFTVS